MTGTDGLFEVRVELGGNIFRIFAFFDKGNLVVLGNGFQKKTQKRPKTKLKAKKIMQEYFNEQNSNKNGNKNKNITTLDEILDKNTANESKKREQWEQEFEAFQLAFCLKKQDINLV